jgi:RNA polymerase-binding transcription factor DksA
LSKVKKRAEEIEMMQELIIAQQRKEIASLEKQIKRIQESKFVCSECRTTICICRIEQWKYF